jgi:hypothetical protein
MSEGKGDAILLGTFRGIGCALPEDVNSVSELTADHLVVIMSKSLFLISEGDIVTPSKLPSNIASRHRICTDLAEKIKVLGLPVKCGYNQILYPVEASTRGILHWIVSKLPSAEDVAGDETLSDDVMWRQRVKKSLSEWQEKPWLLPYCSYGTPSRGVYKTSPFRTGPSVVLGKHDMAALYAWTSKARVPMSHSILELHAQQLTMEARDENFDDAASAASRRQAVAERTRKALAGAASGYNAKARKDGRDLSFTDLVSSIEGSRGGGKKQTRFDLAAEYAEESSKGVVSDGVGSGASQTEGKQETAEERKKRKEHEEAEARAKEIEDLKRAMAEHATRLEALAAARVAVEADAEAASAMRGTEDGAQAALEQDVRLKKEALAMLPKAAENIAKMEAIILASRNKLTELQRQWDAYNAGMQEKLRGGRSATADRQRRSAEMIEQYKDLRVKTQELITDKKQKQKMAQALLKELERLPNIDRSMYTARIMDIIGQIRKQDDQIGSLAQDIRDSQKSINTTSNGVARADAVAEEKIFRHASSTMAKSGVKNVGVESYRSLKTLRDTFSTLVETMKSIGQQDKAATEMETKIELEQARINVNNFKRIKTDLQKIKSENKAMMAKIQGLRGGA